MRRTEPSTPLLRVVTASAVIRAGCPVEKYRDGAKAVEDAKGACELSGWKDPKHLEALAAAYSEDGDFDAAVKWQKKALDDPEYAKKYGETGRNLLSLYERKEAYREPDN